MEPFVLTPLSKTEYQKPECLFTPYKPYKPSAPYKKMSTFSQILHKQNADSNELYSFNMENDNSNLFEFYRLAFSKEFNTSNILATTVKMYTFHLTANNPTNNIKKKFSLLNDIFINKFLNDETKAVILDKFSKTQRVYQNLCRLAYRYKWNKASIKIQSDLCMEPISPRQRNVITILHSDQKYLFTIADLLRIIESSLSNSPYFFAEPLSIKNPYTNLPFQKSQLYNIYFFMRERILTIPPLFQAYFMCNFHLKTFRDENGLLIQKYNIKQHVKNADVDLLYEDALNMITAIKYRGAITFDDDFPKERLVEIMRPYLELFYTYTLTVDMSERNRTKTELSNRLSAFYRYNYLFGRKFIKTHKSASGKTKRIITFNDSHIPYAKTPRFKNYETSHLEIVDGLHSYFTRGDERPQARTTAYSEARTQQIDFSWAYLLASPYAIASNRVASPSVEIESSDDEDENNENIHVNVAPGISVHPDDVEEGEIVEDDDDFEDESDDGNYDP